METEKKNKKIWLPAILAAVTAAVLIMVFYGVYHQNENKDQTATASMSADIASVLAEGEGKGQKEVVSESEKQKTLEEMDVEFIDMSGLLAFINKGDLNSLEEDFKDYFASYGRENITSVTWLPDRTENIDEYEIRWYFKLSDGTEFPVCCRMADGILRFGEERREYEITPAENNEYIWSSSEDVPTTQEIEERSEGGF